MAVSSSECAAPTAEAKDPRDAAVAIVQVNWNGAADCIECLDSLVGILRADDHIYLVDNASSDDSLEKIAAWCAQPTRPAGARDLPGVSRHSDTPDSTPLPVRWVDALVDTAPKIEPGCRISLIKSGANRGFAGGNNVGIKLGLAEGREQFWLLNTDTVIHRDALSSMLERAHAVPDAGIVGSTLLYYDEPGTVQALGGAVVNRRTFAADHVGIGTHVDQAPADPAEVEARMSYVVGASMLVSRAFIERVGLMQEDYFLYFEELDWAVRAEGMFRQCWAPRSLVWHKVGGSSAKVLSEFSARLLLRNRLRFVERFYPAQLASVRRQVWWEGLRHLAKGRFNSAGIFLKILLSSGHGRAPDTGV